MTSSGVSLATENALLMTLMRVWLGLDGRFASILFGVTDDVASSTFVTWVNFLAAFLDHLHPDPGNARVVELTKRMGAFISHSDMTDIIDTTGIPIHRPASLTAQSVTWSDYYSCNCGKILISITPSGYLRFCSRIYPGRISDHGICACGFYEHVRNRSGPKSVVEADKGFYIFFELAEVGADLVLPSGVRKDVQMADTEVQHTATVANERIFVEHAVAAVKRFAWLSGPIPIVMVDLIDPVLRIASGLTNFTEGPFVKSEVRAVYPDNPCAHEIMWNTNLKHNPL
jgi:hypothetical protein